MKPTHTPGPWNIVGAETREYSNIQVLAADNALITRVNSSNHSNEANARLIAAAPELLDALKQAFTALNHLWRDDFDGRPLSDQIRAVIAKAEGGQS